ncbi:MAG: TonB-dependent receptor [Bacteroidia bacterium]
MKSKRGVGILLVWLVSGYVLAQDDSLLRSKQMATFEVCALRDENPNPALLQWSLRGSDDVALSGLSLADVLQRESAVFIKQYGPSMLATPSLRGTGAAHTALIWNGCNLQNGMNGQTDISLVPAFLFGSFTLQQGASSASWGSGAAGGALFLNPSHQNEIALLQENGSFGHRLTALRVALPYKKVRFSLGAFRLQEENNFPFHNLAHAHAPLVEQRNARLEAAGVLATLSVETGKHGMLNASLWLQQTDRHIPPIMSVPVAKAHQVDAALRNTLNWTMHWAKLQIQLRAAWFEERMFYEDSALSIAQNYASRTLFQEAEFSHSLGKSQKITFGLNQTMQQAHSEAYDASISDLSRQSAFAQWDAAFFEARLKVRSGLRKEWTNRADAPIIPFASASLALLHGLSLNGNFSGVYRIPTLNDLYWIPGGNPNLLPEQGTSAELGLAWNLTLGKTSILLRTDAFQSVITNWILWVPGNSYWWPCNVQKVLSRGANGNASIHYRFKKHQLVGRASLQAVSAEVEKSGNEIELHTNRQLIYVPQFNASASAEWRFGLNRIEVQMVHTGLRYTSSDNLHALPAFNLFNVIIGKDVVFGSNQMNIYLRWNNVFNTEYQVMLWRPMPMSSIQLGIQFSINTINK